LASGAEFLKVIQVFDSKNFFMAEKLPFGEGASINRSPLFCGLNYQFWKVRTKILVESIDIGIWDVIVNGPIVPKIEKDDVFIEKLWSQLLGLIVPKFKRGGELTF